jgi:hypothetical protein
MSIVQPPAEKPYSSPYEIFTRKGTTPLCSENQAFVHHGYLIVAAFTCYCLSQRWNQPRLGKTEIRSVWGRGDKRFQHCYTPETVSDTLPAASDAVSLADWRYDFPVSAALSEVEPEVASDAFCVADLSPSTH